MGAKILNSDNEDLKQRVQSGETSISAGYKMTRGCILAEYWQMIMEKNTYNNLN